MRIDAGVNRLSRPLAEARRVARRWDRARSGAYFLMALGRAVGDTPARGRQEALASYEAECDPWRYGSEWGRGHLEALDRVFRSGASGGTFERALDLGCGEGWVTERVMACSQEVVAVDISPIALERARARIAGAPHVRFQLWDIHRDPPLGQFDLILALGVLETFRRPSVRHRAYEKVLGMLAPGGHVIFSITKQAPVVEDAAWSRLLGCGSKALDREFTGNGRLTTVARDETATHVFRMYRKASGGSVNGR